MVTVYSKPDGTCPQCDMTYRVMKSEGISYRKVDITEDADAYSYVTGELGYMQAPVVVTEDSHWSGFRPDLIKSIKRIS